MMSSPALLRAHMQLILPAPCPGLCGHFYGHTCSPNCPHIPGYPREPLRASQPHPSRHQNNECALHLCPCLHRHFTGNVLCIVIGTCTRSVRYTRLCQPKEWPKGKKKFFNSSGTCARAGGTSVSTKFRKSRTYLAMVRKFLNGLSSAQVLGFCNIISLAELWLQSALIPMHRFLIKDAH